uniref:Reverse transcriptase Ty1/copia-type domain-containing protein n=1 Tax=Picocystis salinarum TaxID=88271 RepID=A0A7S3XD32_9CHLO
MWNKLLTTTLKEVLGCACNGVEESVLLCRSDTSVCYICVYVDDILLASSDKALLQKVIDGLCSKFDARHLGPAHLFCGMVITRNRKSRMMHLSEAAKIDKMLEKFGMDNAKESRVPLSECMKQGKEESDEELVVQYQQLVGQLLYLSTTVRPDIAHAAAVLSRYMSKPAQEHWKAAKRVLKYLKGTRTHGLCLGQHEPVSANAEMGLELTGYCDSDFGTDVDTRRSRTGFLFLLNGSLVAWYSKLQKTVATSTAEAEYMAVSACVKEALWIRNFLGSLMNGTWDGIPILNDNQATLRMINDLNSVSRSKHIDIQHHFVRERAVRGEVKFHYCPTDTMLADYLTKVLPSSRFEEIRDALHVVKKQE